VATIKKILGPVDFSDAAWPAIRAAEALAHETGAELALLHVVEDATYAFPEGGYLSPRIIEEYEAAMVAKLSELAARLRTDIAVSARAVHGVPYQAIVDAAEKEHASMIVMGTHGHSGLSHLFLGSVAERVVRLSKVPVLTVRTA